jgi:prophage tail gpP-like protein
VRDPLETIAIVIGGRSISGWSNVSIEYGIEQAARTAELTISDMEGDLPIKPDMPCIVAASGETIITGYVRDVAPSHSESGHSVSVSVVSKVVDLVESSIDHPTGFAKDKTVKEIADEFDVNGVGIEIDEEFPVEARRFVNTGESWFYHMEPLVRSHAGFIYDTPEGKARIAIKPRGRHSGALKIGEGGNILSASAKLSGKERYNPVIVRGQSSRGTGAASLQIEARAEDGEVGRTRPKIIIHESETTSAKVKARAEREVKRAAGKSREATIEVSGWRDEAGKIFVPHFLIAVDDARIYINQDMAIKSVTLTQSTVRGGPGTRATLALCDPRALNGETSSKGGGKAASANVWETPDVEASVSAPKGTVGVDY